jgi:hypothetical protein
MIVAIDYDGTITNDITGQITEDAKIYIPLLYKAGCTLILWTARAEPYYTEAVNKLKHSGLWRYFSEDLFQHGVTGKIPADVYLDDKSVVGEFNWSIYYEHIMKIGGIDMATTLNYECTTSTGEIIIVKTLPEAKNVIKEKGGTYKVLYNYKPSELEAFAIKNHRKHGDMR